METLQNAVPHTLTFEDACRMARGCTDYGGGYRGEEWDIFQHGIQTVIAVLGAAAAKGMTDPQVRAVHALGGATEKLVPACGDDDCQFCDKVPVSK